MISKSFPAAVWYRYNINSTKEGKRKYNTVDQKSFRRRYVSIENQFN